jgi:hypothetical protein
MTYMKMAQVLPNETIVYEESVVRLLDNAIIPFAEGNRDYEQYLAWLEEGNSPIDFDINLLQNN